MRRAISPRFAIMTEFIGVTAGVDKEEEAGIVVERRAREA